MSFNIGSDATPDAQPRRIILLGNPNVGKSALFNALTGLRAAGSNYPGRTVEVWGGRLAGRGAEGVDSPGLNSLVPLSEDERVTWDLLRWVRGEVRAIAIGHPTRLPSLPDIPAVAETYPGFNNTTWYGFLGPAGTPAHVVNKINAEMKRAVADAAFVKHLESIGMVPTWTTPKEMGAMIRTELARWRKVVADAGIKPE